VGKEKETPPNSKAAKQRWAKAKEAGKRMHESEGRKLAEG
jgi:hypothetical protein